MVELGEALEDPFALSIWYAGAAVLHHKGWLRSRALDRRSALIEMDHPGGVRGGTLLGLAALVSLMQAGHSGADLVWGD